MNDVQKCILNIYKEVKDILDRNNITYYGSSGTCLGAIRHGGFIPWDDDMDLVVPIEEYENLVQTLKKELPPHLSIYSPFEKKHFAHLMIKVIDNRTTFIEDALIKYPDSWSGVWVDIIPLCGVPSSKIKREIFYTYLLKAMYGDLYLREDYMGSRFVFLQKMAKSFIIKNRDMNYYMRKQLKFIKKYPVANAEFVMEAGFLQFKKWTSKRKWFDKRKKVKFEDTEVYIPADYDEYLTKQYGDYMELPPVHERTIHNGFIDLSKSYTEYVKNPQLVEESIKKRDVR